MGIDSGTDEVSVAVVGNLEEEVGTSGQTAVEADLPRLVGLYILRAGAELFALRIIETGG